MHGANWSGTFSLTHERFIPTYIVDLGKSDPYVEFTLDGERVFKSQTKKRTLHPEWNETFSVTVVSVLT